MNSFDLDQRRSDGRWGRYPRKFIEWIIAGPQPQPHEIQIELLQHSLTKRSTLVVVIFAMGLLATVAVVVTGQLWAWAWLLAELVLGVIRISLQDAFTKAKASEKAGNAIAPIIVGLIWGAVLAAASYQSVMSSQWIMILLSGICLAGLIGGISSRNAGTPRYGMLLMLLVSLPYTVAIFISPMPSLFFVGLQIPFYLAGMFIVLFENYKVLLVLYHAERENRWLAHHDLLTGLPNRIMKQKRFDELLNGAGFLQAEPPQFTVFWLDLDGFKNVNDDYGHAMGDTVLIAAAGRLRESVRDVDFLCRVGGDEFVILMPSISPSEAAALARRIIQRISEPLQVGSVTLRVGVSIGSARSPLDGVTSSDLLRSADLAMYEAKKRGIGHYLAYSALSTEPEGVNLAPAPDADARIAVRSDRRRDSEPVDSLAIPRKIRINPQSVDPGRELNGRSQQFHLSGDLDAAGPVGPSSRASAF